MRPDPLELLGRRLLDRYVIGTRIASGGMSVVYRAQDERLQRPVCVKVFFGIDREQADYQTSYEHFVQEAFALSQLQHPNTIRIYDFGYLEEEPCSPFYVCELMTGGTLRGLVRREGPLSPERTLSVLEPVIRALAEAHHRGIIHRDIKPSNILFTTAGAHTVVKLADFGIAKAQGPARGEGAVPNRAGETRVSAGMRISLYSPGWAAPEQVRARKVGPTADIFALGLVVAYALSGRRIFSEKNVLETLSRRLEGDAYVVEELEKLGLPRPLTEVALIACRSDPAERYQSVEELYDALYSAVREVQDRVAPAPRVDTEHITEPTFPAVGADGTEPTPRPPPRPPSPASSESRPVVAVTRLHEPEVVAAGRRVLLLRISDEPLLLGGEAPIHIEARLRLVLQPGRGREMGLHLSGLNCFVGRKDARPSSGAEVLEDTCLSFLSPGKRQLGQLLCSFGDERPGGVRVFDAGTAMLAVPMDRAGHAVLLDFGPDHPLLLLLHGGRQDGAS